MKKIITIYSFLLTLGLSVNANSQTIDNYLKNNNLFEAYEKKAKLLQEEKTFYGDLSKLDNSIRLTMNNSLNKEYKLSYLHDIDDHKINTDGKGAERFLYGLNIDRKTVQTILETIGPFRFSKSGANPNFQTLEMELLSGAD